MIEPKNKNHNEDEKASEAAADRLRLEGNERFRANDFEKAVKLYSKSLEAKKTVPTLLNRSFGYLKLNKFEDALRDATEAVLMEPDNLKAKCRRGNALRELGRYSLALGEFRACLEREPNSASFQQLYDQCQKLADEKTFVDIKLDIAGYDAASEYEAHLALVDGVPQHSHIEVRGKRFKSLTQLGTYLKKNIKGSLVSICLEDTVVDEELMKFFRSCDPVLLASGNVEFDNVQCSNAHFAELFGGQLLRPLNICFPDMKRTNYVLTTAIRSLAAIRNTMNLNLSPVHFDQFSNGGNARVHLDALLDLLHSPHPDIPAHIRASTDFQGRPLVSESALRSVNSGERNMTVHEGIAMFRALAGRWVITELNNLFSGSSFNPLSDSNNSSGIGLDILTEAIEKCTQRFLSAQSPVSYRFQMRFVMPTPDLVGNFPALGLLFKRRRNGGTTIVHYNSIGEQLSQGILSPGGTPGEVVTLRIERVRCGTSAGSD